MTNLLERAVSTVQYKLLTETPDSTFVYCDTSEQDGIHIRSLGKDGTLRGVRHDVFTMCHKTFKTARDRRFVTGEQVYLAYRGLYGVAMTANERKHGICAVCADYAVETAGYYG